MSRKASVSPTHDELAARVEELERERSSMDVTARRRADEALQQSEELAEEVKGFTQLHDLSMRLMFASSVEMVAEETLDAVIEIVHADMGTVQVYDPTVKLLRYVATRGFPPAVRASLPLIGADFHSTCARALATGQRVVVQDFRSDPGTAAHETTAVGLGYLAAQSTPLIVEGQVVGMVTTHFRRPRCLTPRELRLIDLAVSSTASLLERARTEEALRASEAARQERLVWLRGQSEALMEAMNGAPLRRSLGVLVSTATAALGDDVRAAFYLADAAGTNLHHIVGMSADYAKTLDGFAIGPESLACGLAMPTGEPVLTSDVRTDPRWEQWRSVAAQFDYRGCWSFPIRSMVGDGPLVGTFAMYWRQPREAVARELQLASLLTTTAAIIISRHRESEVRKQAEDALRRSLSEREALLRELHHRVKNNLQVITSLLEMQARQTADGEELSSLSAARNRIGAIAAIHELLYQSQSFSEVDFADYARRLVRHVVSLYDRSSRVDATVDGDGITIDLARAVPLGLLLNELVSNAYKHAFHTKSDGALRIALNRDDGHLRLTVADTGIGFPNAFDDKQAAALGLQLVRMLAKQLGGTVSFASADGAKIEVRVPFEARSS